ncbi:hypothetical protein CC1G_07187 [Coprinopsis cinerea okayama7|uniref:mRNA stability protein n=1 Tax=Coprinopsis cinerea (strain Okayama-7 / 130 / ATCC MYA-4618 / FGSC 9003) TaxID=240176 RepID=A8NRE0_COPC7|nr:hypothetical protein CC1G_07187 [Coprinopsis cinerea okayama7\|eukprot:XP_001835763.2 hypothetical protein CC1G_07187 [Coprinopsis cinerea okayama7\
MHPAQRNKVDISKLTPQEQQLFAKYGKLPTHKNVLMKMQKDRKYFDSGDYALSKAGKAPQSTVGTAIPNPENIPHASTPVNGHATHPISISPTNSISKESGLATSPVTTSNVEDDQPANKVADEAEESIKPQHDADAKIETTATTTVDVTPTSTTVVEEATTTATLSK